MQTFLRCTAAVIMTCVPLYANATVNIVPVDHLLTESWVIPTGKCQQVDLQLQAGSQLYGAYQVRGAVDSRLGIELVDDWNFRLRQAGQAYIHFTAMSGTIAGGATLKFNVPQAGAYHALFCNDKALLLSRTVYVVLYATRTTLNDNDRIFQKGVEEYVAALHQILEVPPFDVTFTPCGFANASSDPNITICTELIDTFPKDKVDPLTQFTLLHEFGHTALRLWGLPGWDNEDFADEFAAAFLLMSHHVSDVEDAANYWLSRTADPVSEALSKIGVDDRHSLDAQRAKNLHRWALNQSDLKQRWMTQFAPHLTDVMLKRQEQDPEYAGNSAVHAEISRRRSSTQTSVADSGSTMAQPFSSFSGELESGPSCNRDYSKVTLKGTLSSETYSLEPKGKKNTVYLLTTNWPVCVHIKPDEGEESDQSISRFQLVTYDANSFASEQLFYQLKQYISRPVTIEGVLFTNNITQYYVESNTIDVKTVMP